MSGESSGNGKRLSKAEIEHWLINRLATHLQIAPQTLDPKRHLASLGLDSVTAMQLTGELSDLLGCPVDPLVLADYPTIETAAEHLAGLQGEA